MGKKRILILGAGLAGLSAAWHLQKKGVECIIFEKEKEVGGLCRSKSINGFTFDYSGHLLHFKHKYTFNFVRNLLGDNLIQHKRNSWIYSHDRYIPYPFQANFHRLPSRVASECLSGFIQASRNNRHNKKNSDFLSWINRAFGKGIARHFMIPYNSKFWTVRPQELTCEWLDGFIPIPCLSGIINRTLEKNERQVGYNAQFWYPKKGGINQLPLALAREIRGVHTNCPVTEINLHKKTIRINSDNRERFDYLISTLPLPEIPSLVKGLPEQMRSLFRKLRWNSILNLNLGIEKNDSSFRHWIYFPQKDTCFFRVGFFNNFSPFSAPFGNTSLYVEISYSEYKPLHNKNGIVASIKKDLKKIGILQDCSDAVTSDVNDIRYGYPIYNKDYQMTREAVLKYINRNNIVPCGRYGSWSYMSMEDIILDGKLRVAGLF